MQNTNMMQKAKKGQKGSILITVIVSMCLISILTVAIYSTNTTSMLNFVTYNNNENAYYLAESGMRYAMGLFLNTKDDDGDGCADNDKRKILTDKIDGATYNMSRGSFSLEASSYWFYSKQNFAKDSIATLNFAVRQPDKFSIPSKGKLWVSDPAGKVEYTNGKIVNGAFQCKIDSEINKESMIYPAVLPALGNGGIHVVNNSKRTLLLRFDSKTALENSCIPLINGYFEVVEGPGKSTERYFYKTANFHNNRETISLKGIYQLGEPDNSFSSFTVSRDQNSIIAFKKNLVLKSTGTVGSVTLGSTRTINYAITLADTNLTGGGSEITTVSFDSKQEFDENFSVSNSKVDIKRWPSAGGSSIFANMTNIPTLTDSGDKLGSFDFKKKDDIEKYWQDSNYVLNYDMQVKLSSGYQLLYGGNGLSFRKQEKKSGKYEFFGISMMKFYLPSVVFDPQTASILPPDLTGKQINAYSNNIKVGSAKCVGDSVNIDTNRKRVALENITAPFPDGAILKLDNGNVIGKITDPDNWSGYNDFIPEGIKPSYDSVRLGSSNSWKSSSPCTKAYQCDTDFNDLSDNPFEKLIMVFWQQQVDGSGKVSQRWLAYKDLTYDSYILGHQAKYDGRVVNDNVNLTVRIRESEQDGVKVNKIDVFYGDMSNKCKDSCRKPDDISYNVMEQRERYLYGLPEDQDGNWEAIWPSDPLSSWSADVDYFSHIQESNTYKYQCQWDKKRDNVSVEGDIFEINEDGTIIISELTTPDEGGEYKQPEIAMHAFGDINETDSTHGFQLSSFTDFAIKLINPGNKSPGGIVSMVQY